MLMMMIDDDDDDACRVGQKLITNFAIFCCESSIVYIMPNIMKVGWH